MFANVMIKMATKSHLLFRLSVIFLVLLNASQYGKCFFQGKPNYLVIWLSQVFVSYCYRRNACGSTIL